MKNVGSNSSKSDKNKQNNLYNLKSNRNKD